MDEPARKRRRVQEPLPEPKLEKVAGTKYITAKWIKTTRIERLGPVTREHLPKQVGKSKGKRAVPWEHLEPTVLRMMQIGIKKTWEEGLPYELSLLSLESRISSQIKS